MEERDHEQGTAWRCLNEDYTPAGNDALIAKAKMFLQWVLKIILAAIMRSRQRMKHISLDVGPVDINH